jgi:hypothetical protein
MSTETNEAFVRRLIEGINTGNLAHFEETVAPD